MAQHFLLSKAAKTLSLAQVFRMTDAEAETTFRNIRWADTNGTPVCPSCGSVEAYEARRANGALRFRCKGCKKDFTITSGTLFASHKLPLRGYLAAIAVFCNEVKGKSTLALSRDLGLSYKSAFVLLTNSAKRWQRKCVAALSAVKAGRRKLMAATWAARSSPPTLRKIALTAALPAIRPASARLSLSFASAAEIRSPPCSVRRA